MSLKDKLMQEAKNLDTSVELDGIFENANLSEDVMKGFTEAFQESVKKKAVELAESHITQISEKADQLVAEGITQGVESAEDALAESIEKYLDHISQEWLNENKVEVEKSIKSDLFESMFGELKRVFVEHNVSVPTESIDVVAELEAELAESKEETEGLFNKLTEANVSLNKIKKETAIKEATANLTESQKEKVTALVEGVEFNESFDTKLNAIVKMAESSKQKAEPKPITEGQANNNDVEKLNYAVKEAAATVQESTSAEMQQYLKNL